MHLQSITLQNFRGICEPIQISLDQHFTLLVGINGAGKTTILDALATQLGWIINKVLNVPSTVRPIAEHEIHNGQKQATITTCLMFQGLDPIEWKTVKTRSGEHIDEKNDFKVLEPLIQLLQGFVSAQALPRGLPVMVYYAVNRAGLDIPKRIRTKHEFGPISAYSNALSDNDAGFRLFYEWFQQREDLEREQAHLLLSGPEVDLQHRAGRLPKDPMAEAVRRAFPAFLNGFTEPRIRRQSPMGLIVKKNGQELVVDQLSDGEKCLLGLVADLARRLATANPGLANPLEGTGIVLVDELDLHLHPKWQRHVVSALRSTFPNCQFVVSSHSPQVISETSTQSLRVLRRGANGQLAVETPGVGYGLDSNRIIRDLMDGEDRPAEIQRRLDEVFATLDRDDQPGATGADLDRAERLLAALTESIVDDPMLDRALAGLTRRRLRRGNRA